MQVDEIGRMQVRAVRAEGPSAHSNQHRGSQERSYSAKIIHPFTYPNANDVDHRYASWRTSSLKRGSGKVQGAYTELYFLDPVTAREKYLVLTDLEFFDCFTR